MKFKKWLLENDTFALLDIFDTGTDTPFNELTELISTIDPHHIFRQGNLAITNLTSTDLTVGSPDYLSPEAAANIAAIQDGIFRPQTMWKHPAIAKSESPDTYERCLELLKKLKIIDDTRPLIIAWNTFKSTVRGYSESNVINNPRNYMNYHIAKLELQDCDRVFAKIKNLISQREELSFCRKPFGEFFSLHDNTMSKRDHGGRTVREKMEWGLKNAYNHSYLARLGRA